MGVGPSAARPPAGLPPPLADGHDDPDEVGAHPSAHASARILLLTALGEFAFNDATLLRTSSLIYVLHGLGVSERSARQAVARTAAAGWIEGERHGREVWWALTREGRALLSSGRRRVRSLGGVAEPWDGRWLVIIVEGAHGDRALRHRLYTELRTAGFGRPVPGVWLSPHRSREPRARQVISDLGLSSSAYSFVGPAASVGQRDEDIVASAWDLAPLRAAYDDILEEFSGAAPKDADEVLFTHLRVVHAWQGLPFADPLLPEQLLPDWSGRSAYGLLRRLRREWGPQARARWQEIVHNPPI